MENLFDDQLIIPQLLSFTSCARTSPRPVYSALELNFDRVTQNWNTLVSDAEFNSEKTFKREHFYRDFPMNQKSQTAA